MMPQSPLNPWLSPLSPPLLSSSPPLQRHLYLTEGYKHLKWSPSKRKNDEAFSE